MARRPKKSIPRTVRLLGPADDSPNHGYTCDCCGREPLKYTIQISVCEMAVRLGVICASNFAGAAWPSGNPHRAASRLISQINHLYPRDRVLETHLIYYILERNAETDHVSGVDQSILERNDETD